MVAVAWVRPRESVAAARVGRHVAAAPAMSGAASSKCRRVVGMRRSLS
jgi:hypothetical protein